MRTAVVGNRALAKHVLKFLLDQGWNVVGAVSAADEAARRQAGFVPFDALAERNGIELIDTADINDREPRSRLEALDPDLCICPGWHDIISRDVLQIPDRGFVGFHSSDLPRGRGGAPVNWSIIRGNAEIALTLFYYTVEVDAGDVIHTEYVDIEPRDDVDTVFDRLAGAACDALAATRKAFERDDVDSTPQRTENATYRPRRQPQDGLIDWSLSAGRLYDWVRAQTDPYPGAHTFADGHRLTVWSARPVDQTVGGFDPGVVTSVVDGEGIDVATGDGLLRLERVQRDGCPREWADEFAGRHDVERTDSFGSQHAPPSWLYTGLRDETGGVDFSGATNLAVNERGEVTALIESAAERTVVLRAEIDGKIVCDRRIVANGAETVPIRYAFESEGTHTLRVKFSERDGQRDQRFLKVYVS